MLWSLSVVDVQRNIHTVCAKCSILVSRNVVHIACTVLDWEVTALLYATSSQIIWRTWRSDTAERTGHPCSGPHSDRSLAAKARGRYALVWLHPRLQFTTPDKILIRPFIPRSISRPDKWLPSPFAHAKAKVSAISTEKKQLALNKTVTPGKMGLFCVDWFGMAAGTTMIYTGTELHSAETVAWTHGVWLVQDDSNTTASQSILVKRPAWSS
jgi:hypothetical protein